MGKEEKMKEREWIVESSSETFDVCRPNRLLTPAGGMLTSATLVVENKSSATMLVFCSGDTFSLASVSTRGGASVGLTDMKAEGHMEQDRAQLSQCSPVQKVAVPKRAMKTIKFHGSQTKNYMTLALIHGDNWNIFEKDSVVESGTKVIIKQRPAKDEILEVLAEDSSGNRVAIPRMKAIKEVESADAESNAVAAVQAGERDAFRKKMEEAVRERQEMQAKWEQEKMAREREKDDAKRCAKATEDQLQMERKEAERRSMEIEARLQEELKARLEAKDAEASARVQANEEQMRQALKEEKARREEIERRLEKGDDEASVVSDSPKEDESLAFTIYVEKEDEGTRSQIGVDIIRSQGRYLKVEKVKEGVIALWNEDHPYIAVKPGHYIVEVNGVKNCSESILSEIKKAKLLEMKVSRCDPATLDGCGEEGKGKDTVWKENQDGNVLHVIINKTSGAKLGLNVTDVEGTYLQVVTINEGLIQAWNAMCETGQEVQQDNHLFKVNDVTGSSTSMLAEIRNKDTLDCCFYKDLAKVKS